MRYRFAREGIKTVVPNYLEVGSLQWDDGEKIPVTYGASWEVEAILGTASDLRREEDGWITAEVEWNARMIPDIIEQIDKTMWLTIYANNLVAKKVDNVRMVESARLRAIFLCGFPTDEGNPWAAVDE